jgi:flagellin-like hook-associated protein FlgL
MEDHDDEPEPDIEEAHSVAQDVHEAATEARHDFDDGPYLPELADELDRARDALDDVMGTLGSVRSDLYNGEETFSDASEELQRTVEAAEFLVEMLEALAASDDPADDAVTGQLEIGGESFDVTVTPADEEYTDEDFENVEDDEPFNVWLAREMAERELTAADVAEHSHTAADVIRRFVTGEMEAAEDQQEAIKAAVENATPQTNEDDGLGELFG